MHKVGRHVGTLQILSLDHLGAPDQRIPLLRLDLEVVGAFALLDLWRTKAHVATHCVVDGPLRLNHLKHGTERLHSTINSILLPSNMFR